MAFRGRFSIASIFTSKSILFLLILFLLIFPKGGIKLFSIPFTWGYLLLGIVSFALMFRNLWSVSLSRIEFYLCQIPFQIVSLATIAINGFTEAVFVISFFLSMIVFPYIFFIHLSDAIEGFDLDFFIRIFRKGVFFIACFGIVLFFVKNFFGLYIEIPLITTNLGDYGELDRKCIVRFFGVKLISSYNNGNIYGVCVLMLLPIYCYLEKRRFQNVIVKVSLILTFSRTVWIGLFFHEFIYNFFIEDKIEKKIRNLSFFLTYIFVACTFLYWFLDIPIGFFFDSNLGGRLSQLEVLDEFSFFSSKPFECIAEMVYLSVLDFFGAAGLFAFLVAMFGPLFLSLYRERSKFRTAVFLGLVNYLFLCGADGALIFIPTMCFFWFLTSLLARKNLSFSNASSVLKDEKIAASYL